VNLFHISGMSGSNPISNTNCQVAPQVGQYPTQRRGAVQMVQRAISGDGENFDESVRSLRSLDRGVVRAVIHHAALEASDHLRALGPDTLGNIVAIAMATKQLERLRALDGHLPVATYRTDLASADASSFLRAAGLVNATAVGDLAFDEGLKLLAQLPPTIVSQALGEVEAELRNSLENTGSTVNTVQQTAASHRALEKIAALRGHCPSVQEGRGSTESRQTDSAPEPSADELFLKFQNTGGISRERSALAAKCSARCYERDHGNSGTNLRIEQVKDNTPPDRPQWWQRVPIHIRCFVEYVGNLRAPFTNKDLMAPEIKALGGLIEHAVDRGSCLVDYMDYHAHYAESGEKGGQGAGFGRAFTLGAEERMEVLLGRFCFKPGRDSSGREIWVVRDTYDFSSMSASLIDAFKHSVQSRNPYIFLRHLAPLVGTPKPLEFHIPVTREEHCQLFNAESGRLEKPLAPIGYHHIRPGS
jgi:hypothetical protein